MIEFVILQPIKVPIIKHIQKILNYEILEKDESSKNSATVYLPSINSSEEAGIFKEITN